MAFDYAYRQGRARKRKGAGRGAESVGGPRRGMVVRLEAGEALFSPGEAKGGLVYRIRKGRLQVSGILPEGEPGGSPTRIYRAGEFAGLGFLETHAAFGHALEPLEAVVWSRADFERTGEQKPDYRVLHEDAVRLEFLWRRAQVVAQGRVGADRR